MNTSELRALRRGELVVQKRNCETGETYFVNAKLSWGKLYYSLDGGAWYRTPREARLAAQDLAEVES